MKTSYSAGDIEYFLADASLSRLERAPQATGKATYGALPDGERFKAWAIDFLASLFGLPAIELSARETEMRLRIALHFSCPEAIIYDPSRPEPRWRLLFTYIKESFAFTEVESESLARLVAIVLDDWDVGRANGLRSRRPRLLERQGYRCNCCHVPFDDADRTAIEEAAALSGTSDPYKPYFDGSSVKDAMEPHVDHIAAVSRDGTNQVDNLQVLCALCNQGKGDNSGIRVARELELGHRSIREIPRGHIMALLYYRLMMDRFACSMCGSKTNELTVRPRRPEGLNILTNLKAICYECAAGA